MAKFTDLPLSEQRRLIKESPDASLSDIITAYDKENAPQSSGPSLTTTLPFSLENAYKSGGKIHIKPSKRGTFTAAAKKHGKSVQEFASQVLAHPENYSPAMRKKANFARNAARWHAEGGNLYYTGGPSRKEQRMFDRVTKRVATQKLPGEIQDAFLEPMEKSIIEWTDAGDAIQLAEGVQMMADGQVVPGMAIAGLTLLPKTLAEPVVKAIKKSAKKSVKEGSVEAYKKYAKENGLFTAKDSGTGKPVLLGSNSGEAYYLKDGQLYPIEGAQTASSASLPPTNPASTTWNQKEWDNWVAGHEGFFSKAGGNPNSPNEAFKYIPENEWDMLADHLEAAGATPQEYWLELAKLNAAHQVDPMLKYKALTKDKFPNLTDEQFENTLHDLALDNATPEHAYQKLNELDKAFANEPEKVALQFSEHGPWELEHEPMYSGASEDMPANVGHVWNKPYIRVSQSKRESLDQIIAAAREGRTAPLQTTVTDIFGNPAEVSDDWAANLLTDEGKRQAPNGLMYAWKGNPSHELFPGRVGKYGDPYWADVYMGNYNSLFAAEHDLAKTYTGPGYSPAKHIDYSTSGGAPNLMLLAYPKQPIYDTGIDLAGMHWNRLFDPTSENISLYRQLLHEADAAGVKPYALSGPTMDAYQKVLREQPFKLKGYGRFSSVDQISDFLDASAPEFGYNGVLMRNLEDNTSGTGGHGEFIWTPKHGGYPKAVHPANTLELDWSKDSYLRKYGGRLHNSYAGGGPVDVFRKLTAPTYDTPSFSDAFGQARNDGKSYFKWNGRRYNTKLNTEQFREANPVNYLEGYSYIDAARRIKEVENSKDNPRGGYDAGTDRWYPHRSHEGGADTIAYGIKLTNGTPEAELAKRQGYLTDTQANEAVDTLVRTYGDSAERVYNRKFGDGAWDDLSEKSKSILIDYEYNPGLSKFPNLMTGFHDADLEKIKANYKRYSRGRELGRNRTLEKDIDSLATFYPILAK